MCFGSSIVSVLCQADAEVKLILLESKYMSVIIFFKRSVVPCEANMGRGKQKVIHQHFFILNAHDIAIPSAKIYF